MNNLQSPLFLLIRKISPYSGADILLGVFSELEKAEQFRNSYVQQYRNFPEKDPWRKQAYKNPIILEKDLTITEHKTNLKIKDGDLIYVVSSYLDVMGQITRKIDSIYFDVEQAQKRIDELEAIEDFNEAISYAIAQTVLVGNLQSDKPSEQPNRKYFRLKKNIF